MLEEASTKKKEIDLEVAVLIKLKKKIDKKVE
jgi:hypothetical protein